MNVRIILAILLSACALKLGASPEKNSGYVAHEWGTFTSVQAADGVLLKWNPLNVEELPEFVYSLAWPEGKKAGKQNVLAGKTAFLALQRMETPVIYFYTDTPQSVNVAVEFPHGTVTEWYPHATRANGFGERELGRRVLENGAIEWKSVAILPKSSTESPRKDSSGSHYYAARATDANPIRVNAPGGSEIEKYLFYRGVGAFETPLKVVQTGDNAEALELRNAGAFDLRGLFIYRISGNRAAWTQLAGIAPGEAKTVRLQFDRAAGTRAAFHEQIVPELRKALVGAGLFEQEAAAMVRTWDDSWFSEQGIRVLYILPREWTDATLPLHCSPAPEKVARVMVGRAELITPEMEMRLMRELMRYSEHSDQQRALAVENTRKLGLGRFTEAVTRRILERAPLTREFTNNAWELLQACSRPDATRPLAKN